MTLARLAAAFHPLTQRAGLAVRCFHSSISRNNNGERPPGVLPGRPRPANVQKDEGVVDAFDTEDTNLGDAYLDDYMVATASEQSFTPETLSILRTPISEYPLQFFSQEAKVPTIPDAVFRRLLSKAFGVGGWALIPSNKPRVRTEDDGTRYIFRDYVLYAHGKFIAHATGRCPTAIGLENALEGAKGQALKKCCKDLGMASELWDPTWRRSWGQEPKYEDWVARKIQ